jgi:hypothetical protein
LRSIKTIASVAYETNKAKWKIAETTLESADQLHKATLETAKATLEIAKATLETASKTWKIADEKFKMSNEIWKIADAINTVLKINDFK